MSYALPRTLTLPSGARVTLRAAGVSAPAAEKDTYRFAEVTSLFGHEVELVLAGKVVDVLDLPLRDFHVLRAVLTKAGLLVEDAEHFDCHNCGAQLDVHPCARLETGPWEDGEADDPELDHTAPFDEPLDIRPIRVGRVRELRTVKLAERTVRQALPLFSALSKEPLTIDASTVQAMGITALGSLTDAEAIAETLARTEDLDAVTDVFIEAHYPLRLACDVFCSACKARNRVDAPIEREFEHSSEAFGDRSVESARSPLPSLEEFVELAHAIAEPLIADIPGEKVELVVEAGTPHVDDGGEPLLGSYVPPPPKDAPVPMSPPTVTIYFRTFQRIEAEEGPFDWEDELRETIEHELEHHVYWLRGDDPMDAEEHAEIDREVVRVVGRGEATRRTMATFGQSFGEFVRRAWPLIALAALALGVGLAESRCGASLD